MISCCENSVFFLSLSHPSTVVAAGLQWGLKMAFDYLPAPAESHFNASSFMIKGEGSKVCGDVFLLGIFYFFLIANIYSSELKYNTCTVYIFFVVVVASHFSVTCTL